MRRSAALAITCFLLLGIATAKEAAKSDDQHVLESEAAPLFAQSAFAHGYLHGYEEGFHAGDQDFQNGHIKSAAEHLKQASIPSGSGPGSEHKPFRSGYQYGFQAGYNDSVAGRDFRALDLLRTVADDLEMPLPPRVIKGAMAFAPLSVTGGAGEFDSAFSTGYLSGLQYTRENSKPIGDFKYVLGFCMSDSHGKVGPAYCDAYVRGFRVGYADGTASKN